MRRNKKKQERDVEFMDTKELKFIISPLSDKSLDAVIKLIDRYVDNMMKEHVKNKINWTNVDELVETKLRWVLDFKEFFLTLIRK